MYDLGELFSPHVPIGDPSLKSHQPSAVSVAVVIHEIHEVDELDFSFKCKFTVYFTWSDVSMWVACDGHNEEIEDGKCSFLWRPKPTWANARQIRIVDKRLQSFPKLGKALLELTVDGKFSAHMSFHEYPHDYKDLEVEFWLSALAENRNELLFYPVVATFADSLVRRCSFVISSRHHSGGRCALVVFFFLNCVCALLFFNFVSVSSRFCCPI